MSGTSLLNPLCRHIRGITVKTLSPETLEHAKLVLLDTAGVVTAGASNPEVDATARGMARGETPLAGSFFSPGRPESFSLLDAAFVAGMSSSTLEFEEGNPRAMGHPAVQVVPALFTAAQELDCSGGELISALVGGYEAACRVSRAARMRKGLHPSGTWGVVGSALAVGLLRGRSARDLEDLANLAASYAFSPYVYNSFDGWNAAATFAGLVNHLGILANTLFDSGVRAHPDAFEKTFSAFLSEGLDPGVLDPGQDEPPAIVQNYFKPYPTCRFTQPAMEALREIMENHPVEPSLVERISVHSFASAVHGGSGPPSNREALRFSIPYLLAVMIVNGTMDLEVLDRDFLGNPLVTELARKVETTLDPEYEARRPAKSQARVEVILKDGRALSAEILDCLGDVANPLGRDDVFDKFMSLAGKAVGREQARAFLDGLPSLEKQAAVEPWLRCLVPGEKAHER